MGDRLDDLFADPRHPGWGDPPLPAWVSALRESQKVAVREVVEAFERGVRYVVLSAPTGSGKTVIGECARRALSARARYVCVDRGLQDQVLRDFPYAAVLKGRANYPTLDAPDRHASPERLSCDDCTSTGRGEPCRWCGDVAACPYQVAKAAAVAADLAVLNTAYFLTEANASRRAGFAENELVIADECDRLEGALMAHVSVTVGRRRLEEWGLDSLAAGAPPADAAAWVERAFESIDASIKALLLRDPRAGSLRVQRELRGLRRLRGDLRRVLAQLPDGGWVVTRARGAVEFKPIRVIEDAGGALWEHAGRWLLMSATVLSAQDLLEDLGIGVDDPWRRTWAEVDLPSPFPVVNRPIHLLGVAPVVRANPAAPAALAAALPAILERHRGDRVLVHTVSFKLQQELERRLPPSPRYVWYRDAAGRADALRKYLGASGAVLFAPSLERGVDLPDDACRAVVVCKVPYPDLSDAQVAARAAGAGGWTWYRRQALRSLVQMTGRGVRHEADACATYVLDSQADKVIAQGRRELPRWWLEALIQGEGVLT